MHTKGRSPGRTPPARAARVRIIGGAWRRRWLPVAAVPGLRPSADAQRETVFNWLQPHLPGAAVLDLFAGTGALGLEAASRGAGSVWLVEQSPVAVRQLEANCQMLGARQVQVFQGDALHLLAAGPALPAPHRANAAIFSVMMPWPAIGTAAEGIDATQAAEAVPGGFNPGVFNPGVFNIVFVDPPFGQGLVAPVLERLRSGAWLAPGARVYVEQESALPAPAGWTILRERTGGQARGLLLVSPLGDPETALR